MSTKDPKDGPVALSAEELLAMEIEPEDCSWEGCAQGAAKYCRYTDSKGVRCDALLFCAHHFYRHLQQEHPAIYRDRMGPPNKGRQ